MKNKSVLVNTFNRSGHIAAFRHNSNGGEVVCQFFGPCKWADDPRVEDWDKASGFENPEPLHSFIEGAYELGINPLIPLRKKGFFCRFVKGETVFPFFEERGDNSRLALEAVVPVYEENEPKGWAAVYKPF